MFPCDKQIRFLQRKPGAIISSASHMIIFLTYLCIMRTGLLSLCTNMMIHTSSLLRTLSLNDGTARWLFFMLCLIFQFMELNERDSDRSYGGVIFRMRNISQQGSTLLIWGLIKETTLTRFHENCWKYWSNFTKSLITLCRAVKYYNCKDASLGQTLSEKVWKQCMSLTSLIWSAMRM